MRSIISQHELLLSSLSAEGAFFTTQQFLDWFGQKSEAGGFAVRQIPFRKLTHWSFDPLTGDLGHESGKFFTIHGIEVETNFPHLQSWQQPIIHQPEIGILGILVKKFDGIPHFLMQAKMEPGNINMMQLSPTLQATKSNFSRVHKGKLPLYFDWFTDSTRGSIIVDQLQNEQGARYYNKRNRNVIIAVEDEVLLHDDFCWLTLGQIKQLLRLDNIVNMDSRTVLAGIQYINPEESPHAPSAAETTTLFDIQLSGFGSDLYRSLIDRRLQLHRSEEIISWFTRQKAGCEVTVKKIPLAGTQGWLKDENEIFHESRSFFSIIAVEAAAGNREVSAWQQPILKHFDYGLVGFLVSKINGVLHFLIEAHMCPGYPDMLEMGPSLACSQYQRRLDNGTAPPLTEYFIHPAKNCVHFSAVLSEEGGRFYHFQNRYMIVEIDSPALLDLPDRYIWMTFGQLMEFIKHTNYVNIEARTLISCLNFI
jgi:dTDP-4-dehydro-6-deoxy-alpha-D-glucopyranose 2,3-dehydratase